MNKRDDSRISGNAKEYVVRADFYGDMPSNTKKFFWLPQNKGTLYLSGEKIHYRHVGADKDFLEVAFKKIIKIKVLTLNPRKNQWNRSLVGNPFYFFCWNPFWNRYLINVTYLSEGGEPREIFFKLKTEKITHETMELLKKMLTATIVTGPGPE